MGFDQTSRELRLADPRSCVGWWRTLYTATKRLRPRARERVHVGGSAWSILCCPQPPLPPEIFWDFRPTPQCRRQRVPWPYVRCEDREQKRLEGSSPPSPTEDCCVSWFVNASHRANFEPNS
jgi:hypothetical protein